MRKRRKSKLLLIGSGAGVLLVVALVSWTIGKADGRSNQQMLSPRTSSQFTTIQTQTELVTTQVQITAPQTTPSVAAREKLVETPKTTSGMQLFQLIAGDFTSIEGVWVNGYGHTLTFGPAGLMDGKGTVQGLKDTDRGTVRGYLVTESIGGGILEFLPVGTAFSDHVYPTEEEEVTISDVSDTQQERIWLGHDFAQIGDGASFFYRRN